VADDDGDGFSSGFECTFDSNPDDSASVPVPPGADGDKDGLNAQYDRFVRAGFYSGATPDDLDNDSRTADEDNDADGDTLTDGCEAASSFGTSEHSVAKADSDADGTMDVDETSAKTQQGIGNAKGILGDDLTNPKKAGVITVAGPLDKADPLKCVRKADDPDFDGDGLTDTDELAGTSACGVVTKPGWPYDSTVDQDQDANPATGWDTGTDVTFDPAYTAPGTGYTSFDSDGDGRSDGAECTAGTPTDPNNILSRPAYNNAAGCGLAGAAGGGADQDGVRDDFETCGWGTSIGSEDTDGDSVSDCVEIGDNDSDLKITTADVNNMKKALFVATFGKDRTYDIDGDGKVTSADLNQLLKWNFEAGTGAGKCRQAFDS
jgi:hypothetical protein